MDLADAVTGFLWVYERKTRPFIAMRTTDVILAGERSSALFKFTFDASYVSNDCQDGEERNPTE